MALKTTLEQLEEVQTAISEVLEAQSAGIGDMTFLRAKLSDLETREERLLKRYKSEQGTGGVHINVGTLKR
jgi:hypothetical protein